MDTSSRSAMSDLWDRLKADKLPATVRTYAYVGQISGPVITVITNQPVDIGELLSSVSRPRAESGS